MVQNKGFARMIGRISRAKKIIGSDIAGRVVCGGDEVKQFQPGDLVFGDLSRLGVGFGGFAQYVCAPEGALVRKPKRMTFEQAAAIPESGTLAYQAILARGPLKHGQKVLVNGAGGGVGTIASKSQRYATSNLLASISRRSWICYVPSDMTMSSPTERKTSQEARNATISSWIPRPIVHHSTMTASSMPAGRMPRLAETHAPSNLCCSDPGLAG